MVSTNRDGAERRELVERLARPERSAHAVAEIHDQIDGLRGYVLQHAAERDDVTVNVADDGNAHGATLGVLRLDR